MALIPALDAGDTVGQVVKGTLPHVDKVVVVDDGSSDDTGQNARDAGAYVISHAKNMGKGAALKTGFAYALKEGYDAVLTLDADTQHDTDDIPKLLDASKSGAGIVMGARLSEREKIPPLRYHTNMAGVRFISWRSGCRLEDSQSGFRVYKAEVLRDMKFTSTHFETETEILIRAGRRGYKIVSVPVKTIYSDEIMKRSHYKTVWDTTRICILLIRSFFWLRP